MADNVTWVSPQGQQLILRIGDRVLAIGRKGMSKSHEIMSVGSRRLDGSTVVALQGPDGETFETTTSAIRGIVKFARH